MRASITVGLSHPERFDWIGGFGSGVPSKEVMAGAPKDTEAMKRKLKFLWIACGRDDFLLKQNETFIALLRENNVSQEWHLTVGAHSRPVWRKYLAEFAPRLFQEGASPSAAIRT